MGTPFWSAGLRFECQGTGHCCTARYRGVGYVYVSKQDRARLAAHLGLRPAAFMRRYCVTTAGEVHFKHPERDCQFLEGHRCSVYEARPTQCRTWPFWPENMTARAWRAAAASCPGMDRGRLHAAEEIRALLSEARAATAKTTTGR